MRLLRKRHSGRFRRSFSSHSSHYAPQTIAEIASLCHFLATAQNTLAVSKRYPNPEDANYIHLDTPRGEPLILLQKVEHPSRVHLDIDTDDVESEVGRLVELGAREHARVRDFVIMEAPTGHRFCVVPIGSDQNLANRSEGNE